MGKFVGRDILLDQLEQITSINSNEIKGLKGEIEVGDLLAQYLPQNTYIIAHPVIGKYEPDLLVISPNYGFRLIEVKNWSSHSLMNIQSNGSFTVAGKTDNPLQQVRKHADDLKGYLISNHSYFGDPHKLIGYVTIHYGFNKRDIDKYLKNWDEKNAFDFFTFHLFKDELDSQLDKRLAAASKFRKNNIPINIIEEIVKKIRVSNKKLSESEINFLLRSEEIDRTANELKELTESTKQLIIEQSKINSTQNVSTALHESESISHIKNSKKSKSAIWGVFSLIIVAVILFIIYEVNNGYVINDNSNSSTSISSEFAESPDIESFTNDDIQKAFLKPESYVSVYAYVEEFIYDSSSGNKFLKLKSVNTDSKEDYIFDAVIFEDTDVPYVNKGEVYIFNGVTQEYDGKIELKITSVE